MYNTLTEAIKILTKKAEDAPDAANALKLSQSALNLAHVLAVIRDVERQDFLVDK